MDLFGGDVAGRIAARMLSDGPYVPAESEMFAVSVRLPQPLKEVIDAMTAQAEVSRNTLIIDLLRSGVQDVLSQLPREMADELLAGVEGDL